MAYSAPGGINELDANGTQAWNQILDELFAGQIEAAKQDNPASGRAWMFNPIGQDVAGLARAAISWTAFPKRVSSSSASKKFAWERADSSRDTQEEYCEWEVVRDTASGKIVRVTFSCETRDYYDFLWESDRGLLLDLYRRFVSPNVQEQHLSKDGGYNPRNRWNFPESAGFRGVLMHMAQRDNTFGAAVNLAARATWPRVDGQDHPITGEQGLIACVPFGVAGRHSDPHIGAEINRLVRNGNEIGFADPVGLYIESIDLDEFETPDSSEAADWFKVTRGGPEQMLRLVFQAPAGSDFVLGDARIGGQPLAFGGQIAEKMQIRLTGLARPAEPPAPRLRCPGGGGAQILGMAAAAPPEPGTTRGADTPFMVSPE